MDADDDCHHYHHHRVVWWWSHACLFRHKRIHHQLDTLTDRQTWFNDDVHQDLGQFSSRKKLFPSKLQFFCRRYLDFCITADCFFSFLRGVGEINVKYWICWAFDKWIIQSGSDSVRFIYLPHRQSVSQSSSLSSITPVNSKIWTDPNQHKLEEGNSQNLNTLKIA